MNQDLRFDRVYLRTAVWPLLEKRWPGAAIALTRAARHMAEAQQLLEVAAAADLAPSSRRRGAVDSGLKGFVAIEARQRSAAVAEPRGRGSAFHRAARRGAASGVRCGGRPSAGNRLRAACIAALSPEIICNPRPIRRVCPMRSLGLPQLGPRSSLGPGLGNLTWIAQRGGIAAERLPASVIVRRRDGGETLKPAISAKTQTLQHLCQALGVLPWMRDALPLVFAGDELIAVARFMAGCALVRACRARRGFRWRGTMPPWSRNWIVETATIC